MPDSTALFGRPPSPTPPLTTAASSPPCSIPPIWPAASGRIGLPLGRQPRPADRQGLVAQFQRAKPRGSRCRRTSGAATSPGRRCGTRSMLLSLRRAEASPRADRPHHRPRPRDDEDHAGQSHLQHATAGLGSRARPCSLEANRLRTPPTAIALAHHIHYAAGTHRF